MNQFKQNMRAIRIVVASVLSLMIVFPIATFAESFEVSAWIPYWRAEKGVESISPQLNLFTEVNPFIYTVRTDGTLNQADKITGAEWRQLRKESDTQDLRFVPTVMWSNSDAIHETLSRVDLRQEHIRAIASEVYRNGFDGIDIDYEAKYAKTRPYFSLFLKELNEAIGYDKWIMCTIESRTPLIDRYGSADRIPDDIEYSNDFVEINKHCDRVRLMTYDQRRFDLVQNKKSGDPYIPVADVAWVEKAVRMAMEDIDADKIMVGVATYGHEYDMFTNSSGGIGYSRLGAVNPTYALDVAGQLNIPLQRNISGEAIITFPASQVPDGIVPLPDATRVITWSDAEAIRQKVELAQELGVRGISIFKIDSSQDPGLWGVLQGVAGQRMNTAGVKDPDIELAISMVSHRVSVVLPESDLESGDRNENVRSLQKALNTLGFDVASSGLGSTGNETTFFGAGTRGALIKFQKTHNIYPAVGYYGPITRSVMRAL